MGLCQKSYLPNYSEFYEARQFVEAPAENGEHLWKEGESVPFGANLIFTHQKYHRFSFGIELCEDLWTPIPPSGELAMAGAHIILNLSASDELTGKAGYRRELVKNQSARTLSAYLYADAGEGESTMDMVFAGHNLIVENGVVLKESKPFAGEKDLITEIDLGRLHNERRRMTTFTKGQKKTILRQSGLIQVCRKKQNLQEVLRRHHLFLRPVLTEKNDVKKFWQFSRMDLPNACATPAVNMR